MVNALSDTAVTTAGTPATINVLADDTGTGLIITSFSNPANGSLVFNGDKSFTYTPAAGFLGDDTFSYTVRDDQGTPATAEVTISVIANTGATVATDDFVEVVAGGGLVMPVLANDMAASGGELQIIAVSVPGHGVVNVLADQSIRYVPQTGFVGIDSFTYTVLDAQGSAASATVTVKVVAANSAPIAMDDSFAVVADTTTVLAILANDNDPNGGPLQIVGFTMPAHGNLDFDTTAKTFSYTPAAGYEGPDQFTYTIRDNRGASASASVTLTVARTVASPGAVDDQVTTEAGVPVTIDVLANDSLPAGQDTGIIAVTLPFQGKLDFNPDETITYTPKPGFVGTDDFTYTLGNSKGDTARGTVTIVVTPGTTSADTFANGYGYRRRVVLPAQPDSAAAIEDGVVLVHERGTWLKSAAHGGKVTNPDGADIRFEDAEGGKLDHEIESYDFEVGELLAWVRLPSWALASQKQISLFYGNSAVTQSEANPLGVWQGYLARWRLPEGSDTTGQGREFTLQNVGTGQLLGSAAQLDGTGYLLLENTDWLTNRSTIAFQALVKPDSEMVGSSTDIIIQGAPGNRDFTAGLTLSYLAQTSAGVLNVIVGKIRSSGGNAFALSAANQQTSETQLLHTTWTSGNAPKLYINGIEGVLSRSASAAGLTSVDAPLYIGDGWKGLIDEVRITDRVQPSAWLALEARNMLSPEFSYGLGAEERPDGGRLAPIAVPYVTSVFTGKFVAVDVLSQAVHPDADAATGLTVVGISQPTHGVATVVGELVQYTAPGDFVGRDEFTYTISDGLENATGRIGVTVAAAAEAPSLPPNDDSPPLPPANGTTTVSNTAQFVAAAASVPAGHHILLAAGGTFPAPSGNELRFANGTNAQPIVVRPANKNNVATLTGEWQLFGDHWQFWGTIFDRSAAGAGSRAVRLETCDDGLFAYCTVKPGGMGIEWRTNGATNIRCHRTHFDGSVQAAGGDNGYEAFKTGVTNSYNVDLNALFDLCYFTGFDKEREMCKFNSKNTRMMRCHTKDCRDVSFRFSETCSVIECRIEGPGGGNAAKGRITAWGPDNVIRGNIVGSLLVCRGTHASNTPWGPGSTYFACARNVVQNNTANEIVVGRNLFSTSWPFQAVDTTASGNGVSLTSENGATWSTAPTVSSDTPPTLSTSVTGVGGYAAMVSGA